MRHISLIALLLERFGSCLEFAFLIMFTRWILFRVLLRALEKMLICFGKFSHRSSFGIYGNVEMLLSSKVLLGLLLDFIEISYILKLFHRSTVS